MERFFPILASLKGYSKEYLKSDLMAGFVVGVMLIPQGMAYAMIAGLPPVYGLYTAIFPTVVYVLVGSSRHVSVGPVALDALILAAGMGSWIALGSDQYILMVAVMTATVGLIQLGMGMLRLGFLANFLSKPVINGFTFAAAVIIAINQLKSLLGISTPGLDGVFDRLWFVVVHLHLVHLPTLLISLVSFVLLLGAKKWIPGFPASLLVVALGILLSFVMKLDQMGVSLVGYMPGGLPDFSLPVLRDVPWDKLLPLAFTLSLMGFVELYSIGQRLQSKHKSAYQIQPNRELVGVGLGNLIGSFFTTFPSTASFSRSAVNESSGAKTGVASLFSVFIVVITLCFLMPVFQYLPHAVLGAIIFVAVLGLIDVSQATYLWKTDVYDFVLMLVSFACTLIFGIASGIMVGVVLSLVVLIYKTSNPHIAILGKVKGTSYYRNIDRFDEVYEDPEVAIVRFDARLFFANLSSLQQKVNELVRSKSNLKKFILDAQSISDIDSSGLEGLEAIADGLNDQGIQFHIVSMIGPVRDKLFKSGVSEKIRLENMHDCIEDAVRDHATASRLVYQTNSTE